MWYLVIRAASARCVSGPGHSTAGSGISESRPEQDPPLDGQSLMLDTVPVRTGAAARSSSHSLRGLLLVSLAGVIWGTTGPVVQLTVSHSALSPITISAYRALAAAVVLNALLCLTGRMRRSLALARRHRGRLVMAGLLIAASQLLFFMSVEWAGVSLSTVICMGFAPTLLLAVSSAQKRRLPSTGQVLTVTMAVAGLLLISLVGGGREHASNPALGILAALGAGACFALTAEVGGSLSQGVDTLTITTAIMNIAALVLVPCDLVLAAVARATSTADTESWLLVGYLAAGVVATHLLMFAGLRTTPSGAAMVATLLEPVTAVLIAAAFLGEHLSDAGVLGCLFIVAAIASLGRFEDQAEHSEPNLTPTPL
jgi:drug/metabolite transporter, DME family